MVKNIVEKKVEKKSLKVNKFHRKKKFKKCDKKVKNVTKEMKSDEVSSNWKAFLKSQKSKVETDKTTKQVDQKTVNHPKHMKQKRKNNKDLKERVDIWFDDVDPSLLDKECGIKTNKLDKTKSSMHHEEEESLKKERNVTRYVGLDCEMVGVGIDGKENALARVSIVNSLGDCIYDKFVKLIEKVVDYRTDVSGVRASDLKDAPSYETVQKEVAEILKGRILVGHALKNDLKVLMLSHSRRQIRDTSKYKPFQKLLKTKRPALRKLAAEILHQTIQCGEHSSVIDARVTMVLYQLHKKEWEKSLRMKGNEATIVKVFMGNEEKKRKNNKWTKIKQKRNKKL